MKKRTYLLEGDFRSSSYIRTLDAIIGSLERGIVLGTAIRIHTALEGRSSGSVDVYVKHALHTLSYLYLERGTKSNALNKYVYYHAAVALNPDVDYPRKGIHICYSEPLLLGKRLIGKAEVFIGDHMTQEKHAIVKRELEDVKMEAKMNIGPEEAYNATLSLASIIEEEYSKLLDEIKKY